MATMASPRAFDNPNVVRISGFVSLEGKFTNLTGNDDGAPRLYDSVVRESGSLVRVSLRVDDYFGAKLSPKVSIDFVSLLLDDDCCDKLTGTSLRRRL